MTIYVLALPWLFDEVSKRFIADGVPASNLFGWRVPTQHAIGNRLAWVPGDPTGAFGQVTAARNPGGYPRSLATTHEVFTVIINGQDPSEPENERRQYEIVRYLRDAWYRAVYQTVHGAWLLKREEWIIDRSERRFGAALRIIAEIEATVPDLPYSQNPPWVEVPPPVDASIDVTELDVTENIQVNGT
jgi:hypothetical protein